VECINAHMMRRLGVSRRELFENVERPALRPLPAEPQSGPDQLDRRFRGGRAEMRS
jgi:hypothetical protein